MQVPAANTPDNRILYMIDDKEFVFPAPLQYGSKIAVCSPAGPVDPAKVHAAKRVLEDRGWVVDIAPHALGRHGNYAATDDQRYADMAAALTDPDVRAVLCSRGGYGVVHIMERLAQLPLRRDPKWVIGFSDISAMHALMASKGIASIHASMAENIARGPQNPCNARLFDILGGKRDTLSFNAGRHDRPGVAQGRLLGGNLAVLADLINTPYDIIRPGTLLFVEDVSEPIYKIERIMYQLRIAGILPRLGGLLVGQFTEYRPDASYRRMEDMIADMVAPYDYPVAFDVPIGHVDHNQPVIEGAMATLKVTATGTNHLIYWPQ